MSTKQPVRAGMIGCGEWARMFHLPQMLQPDAHTRIVAVCEPSEEAYAAAVELCAEAGQDAPPNQPDVERFLAEWGPELDAVLITSPHVYHYEHATACLEAGLDVLLEKPMVMTADEARQLIATRDRTGRHLVVAFQGSLSPAIRHAVDLLRSGELGELLTISATVWQGWRPFTVGTWRQDMALSGGGMMFDTGAHLMNTVADLAGEPFVEVAAWMDQRDTPVDVNSTVMARLASGALVTMHACGDTFWTTRSEIYVMCTRAVLQTGAWGERLLLQRDGEDELAEVDTGEAPGPWRQFLRVRAGEIANPSPPEVGLRMAQLWDLINESARQGGRPVRADGA